MAPIILVRILPAAAAAANSDPCNQCSADCWFFDEGEACGGTGPDDQVDDTGVDGFRDTETCPPCCPPFVIWLISAATAGGETPEVLLPGPDEHWLGWYVSAPGTCHTPPDDYTSVTIDPEGRVKVRMTPGNVMCPWAAAECWEISLHPGAVGRHHVSFDGCALDVVVADPGSEPTLDAVGGYVGADIADAKAHLFESPTALLGAVLEAWWIVYGTGEALALPPDDVARLQACFERATLLPMPSPAVCTDRVATLQLRTSRFGRRWQLLGLDENGSLSFAPDAAQVDAACIAEWVQFTGPWPDKVSHDRGDPTCEA